MLTSAARTQDEQWLQYRTSRDVSRIIGGISGKYIDVTYEKPQGIELPELKSDEPLFVHWTTPMLEAGGLWIALDRSRGSGPCDRLFIDSNGDGNLKNETLVAAYRADSQHASFGPVKVTFEGEDGPIAYHLDFALCDHGQRRLRVSPGGWYEGTVTVGPDKKHCVLIDQNVNGTFNDKSLNAGQCDRIRIGKKDERDTRFVGNYIEIDGALYQPEIARDGAYIRLARAKDVRLGDIRLPESVIDFSAGGENGLLSIKPKNGAGKLAVGKYRIEHWAIERKDEQGARWKLQGSAFSQKGLFDIAKDKETELSIGEPIISTVQAQNKNGTYSFSHDLKGQLDERIVLTRNGSRPQAPKLHIKSKDGTYDRTYSFQYG
jgi:hypothetical protein